MVAPYRCEQRTRVERSGASRKHGRTEGRLKYTSRCRIAAHPFRMNRAPSVLSPLLFGGESPLFTASFGLFFSSTLGLEYLFRSMRRDRVHRPFYPPNLGVSDTLNNVQPDQHSQHLPTRSPTPTHHQTNHRVKLRGPALPDLRRPRSPRLERGGPHQGRAGPQVPG